MQRNDGQQHITILRYGSNAILGGALALLICFVLLFLCSLGISNGLLRDRSILQYTIIVCAISCFLGGSIAVHRNKSKVLFIGMGSGLIFFMLLVLVGILSFSKTSLEHNGIAILGASLVGGILSGLLGGKQKKKRRT